MPLALVIGGAGFLGRHIVDGLINDRWTVRVFDILQSWPGSQKVEYVKGDLCKSEDLCPALKGVETVFHCASPPPSSNNRALFLKVNVEGTKNIIKCCRQTGVKKLVLTSSASVLYEGTHLVDATEDHPYAGHPMDAYSETKAVQESLVLEASDDTLYTTAIRPHGIFGPDDPQLLPTTVATARAGKMKFMIGDGKNEVDFTFVRNVVHGHLLAEKHLSPDGVANGQAYHITNDEKIRFWTFLTRLLNGLGYEGPKYRIPLGLVYTLAVLLEFVAWVISPFVTFKPTFTPSRVLLAGTHHSYSCKKAKEQLGYKPLVSLDDAIDITVKSCPHLKNPSPK